MYTKWHFLNFCPPNQWDDPDADGVERVSLVNISGKKLVFFFFIRIRLSMPTSLLSASRYFFGGKKSGKEIQGNFQFLQMYPQIKQRTL